MRTYRSIRLPALAASPAISIARAGTAVAQAVARAIASSGSGSTATRLATNIMPLARYWPGNNFLNVLLDAQEEWRDPTAVGTPPSPYVSRSGWPTNVPAGAKVSLYVKADMSPTLGYFQPGTYNVFCSNPNFMIRIRKGGFGGSAIGSGTSTCTFTTAAPTFEQYPGEWDDEAHTIPRIDTWAHGSHWISIELENISGTPQSVTPGRNGIGIVHQSNASRWAAGEIWQQDLLDSLDPYAFLRHMDTSGGIEGVGDSMDNMAPGKHEYIGIGPWPPELIGDLGKKLNCGIWYCLPYKMDYLFWDCFASTNTFKVRGRDGGSYRAVPFVENERIMLSVREACVSAFSGADSGPYYAVNVTSTTFQIAMTSGGAPIDIPADIIDGEWYYRGCSRVFEQTSTVWDACVSRFHEEYPDCPEVFLEALNEGVFSSNFASWGFAHSILPVLMRNIRTGTPGAHENLFQPSWGEMYAQLWDIGATYFGSRARKLVLSGRDHSGYTDEAFTTTLQTSSYAGQKVKDLVELVGIANYTPGLNTTQWQGGSILDWNGNTAFPGAPNFVTSEFWNWTDDQMTNWALGVTGGNSFNINENKIQLNYWKQRFTAWGRATGPNRIRLTTYETATHFTADYTEARDAMTQAQMWAIEDRIHAFFYGPPGATWRAGVAQMYADYEFDAYNQYQNIASRAYRTTKLSHWEVVSRSGQTNAYLDWLKSTFRNKGA